MSVKPPQALDEARLTYRGDVLYSFPRTYKDFTRVLSPAQIREEGEYLISGELVDLTERPVSGGRRMVQASLYGDGSYARLTWFLVHRGRGSPTSITACRKPSVCGYSVMPSGPSWNGK